MVQGDELFPTVAAAAALACASLAVEPFLALTPSPTGMFSSNCQTQHLDFNNGAGGWIRTIEAFASDLQSDPFGHSGTPAKRAGNSPTQASACQPLL